MSEKILAPLAGKVIALNIEVNGPVEEDEEVMVIEAMKMETPVYAPCSGNIVSIHVNEGDEVEEDELIATIETE